MVGSTDAVRQRILDLAEQVYAGNGLYPLSLQAIVRQTGIGITDVIRAFPSRRLLIDAMLLRLLVPISEERMGLLQQMRARLTVPIQPTHIVVCLILPLIRDFANERSPHQAAFLTRAAYDLDPIVREFFTDHFHEESEVFVKAFSDSAAGVMETMARWKAGMFVNILPGTTVNSNLITLCQQSLSDPGVDCLAVLLDFGMLAHGALLGHADESKIRALVSDSIELLADSPTLHALRQLLVRGI